jgi:hypothetical protein
MTTIENVNYAAMHAELDRQDAAQSATEQAQDSLEREMRCALLGNPRTPVRTPGFGDSIGGKRSMPAVEVVADMLADADGESFLVRFIGCVGTMARAGNAPAMMLIDDIARKHGVFHCDDLAQEQGE